MGIIREVGKTSDAQITKDFSYQDFKCKGTSCGCNRIKHDPTLSAYLQRIADHFNATVTITSGYRCEKHNTSIGGSSESKHKTGEAADISVEGVSPLTVAKYAETLGIKGIGYYDSSHGYFVHIDTRDSKHYWKNSGSNSVTTFGGEYDESEAEIMLTSFDTGIITATTYTTDDSLSKLYVVTCSTGGTPYRTLVIPREVYGTDTTASVKIEDSSSFVTMRCNSDNTSVTIKIVNSNSESWYIKHIVGLY